MFIFQHESELYGRTIRVNLAKPQKVKEGSSRPVWADDDWLKQYAGQTLDLEAGEAEENGKSEEKSGKEGTSKRSADADAVSSFIHGPSTLKGLKFYSFWHEKHVIKEYSWVILKINNY